VVRDLAEALAYAHGLGIVHRDVKPANIMLDERAQPHLMDFGLAHRHDAAQLTHEGAILGTPAYMAPEQAQGQTGEPLPASDQYSLGVVLYELLCGQRPFSGPPEVVLYNAIHTEPPAPRTHRPNLPRDLETVCLKAMAKPPHDRYSTCQELADDLRRWLEGDAVRARRLGYAERVVRWCRREPVRSPPIRRAAHEESPGERSQIREKWPDAPHQFCHIESFVSPSPRRHKALRQAHDVTEYFPVWCTTELEFHRPVN
jgi:serine/threonine protein kinase